MQEWIINLATNHIYIVYLIVLAVAFFEGPIISLVVGFLTFIGYLNIEVSIMVLILGNVIPDSFLYYIGRFGHGKKFVEKYFLSFNFISKNIKFIEKMWNHHPWKTAFLGKMAYGLSMPVLITLGLIKVPFKKFFYYTTIVNIFQASTIFFIGYNLSYSYQIAEKYVKFVGIFFLLLVIFLIVGYSLMTKYFENKFIEEERKEEQLDQI
jgi:membrane protein DedA with SNARE-associated domain